MNKKNRIILPVDFSEYSENQTEFAFRISDMIEAKIIFVHSIGEIASTMDDQQAREEITRTETEEALAELRKLAKGRVDEDSFLVSSKPILSTLEELSDESYFDWVLAGLKGTGVLKQILIGSTTISIIDETNMLTMAVPSLTPMAMPEKLLVGIQPRFALNKQQLNIVLTSLKSEIKYLEFFTVLKEDEDETEARSLLQSLQKAYKAHHPEIQLFKGDDTLSLLQRRMENNPDSFLILQQGSRLITDRLFRKFTINELVYSGKTPLIVLSE
ncbi:MAG: universal stress protein [Cyclobacteriaceae bacterium]